jgi:N4-gp56 family major capsid protein
MPITPNAAYNTNYTYDAGVSPSVIKFYERNFMKEVEPELIHNRDAQKRTLPLNNGKTIQFTRITELPAITTPLVEGVTPDGQKLTETAFTAMVKPYGGYIAVTDEFNWYLLGNKHKEASERLSRQAALSLDTISRDALHAGMNVQYAGSNTTRGTIAPTDKLTYADIKKAVRTLRRANAKPFSDGYFHGILHTDVYYDLTSDTMWTDVAKYQTTEKVEKYELGKIYKVRFFESTNAKVFTAQTYIVGTTTAIAASANYDATNRELTTNVTITPDMARDLTGRFVNVQYTKSSTNYVTPMCIESVDYANKKIKFRWNPDASVYAEWTTAQSLTIVPYGGGASGAPVYSTLVYAENSYGSVELGGNGRNVEIIVKPAGSSGSDDPLNQRGSIAWKVRGFCTVILNDNYIVRIESGATA